MRATEFGTKLLHEKEIVRNLFVSYLKDADFIDGIKDDADMFHKALLDAEEIGLVHYTRLAEAMDVDASTVSRWFKSGEARKTPDFLRRKAAAQALRRIIEYDVERAREGLAAIGGKSVNEEPSLGIIKIGHDEVSPFSSAAMIAAPKSVAKSAPKKAVARR